MTRLAPGVRSKKVKTLLLVACLLPLQLPAFSQTTGSDNVPIKTLAPLPAPAPAASDLAPDKPSGLTYTPPGTAADSSINPQPVKFESDPRTQVAQIQDPSEGSSPATTGSAAPSSVNDAAPEVTNPIPLAQLPPQKVGYPPAQASKTTPTTVGTVQVRKPFKGFIREELIRNLSFRDTPVKEVIAEIARRGNMNIIIDKSVVGRITGDLHDVTLNEAMDSVLAAAGLQNRRLDNNSIIVGTNQAMIQLGLNRTIGKAFKLSYSHPYDVAQLLYASVFNRGYLPDFNVSLDRRLANSDRSDTRRETQDVTMGNQRAMGAGGGENQRQNTVRGSQINTGSDEDTIANENRQVTRPDNARNLRGLTRAQTQEGVGFNNAATDPGSQQIRQFQETPTDYSVEQNGGGAIVIPDTKNRQIIVIGTQDDLNLAEEAIRLIDRRPRQVHIQASLVELTNDAIRQIGANIQLQGEGASTSLLGNAAAPLVQFLPGLGSPGLVASNSTANNALLTTTGPPAAQTFTATSNFANATTSPTLINVTPSGAGTAFSGLVGSLLPVTAQTIAGVASTPASASGFNFLTLGKRAGGRANIATLPTALNVSLNMILQTEKAKIIANPSVVVTDNTEALITIASEVIHKVTATVSLGVVSTNVELTKAGIFLNVLPKITEDGFITMRLRPQVSAPIIERNFNNTTIVTLLSIREIMSQEVRIKDGQTLVLGGLFQENEAARIAKVPYLAETPVLGALFRNTLKGRFRSELMLLLTPKIVEEEPPVVSEGPTPSKQM